MNFGFNIMRLSSSGEHIFVLFQIATFLYLTKEVPNETVQILTQYDAQCSEIKRRLEENGITTANDIVSTVNSSQGVFIKVLFN
jgi:hypothetical protein